MSPLTHQPTHRLLILSLLFLFFLTSTTTFRHPCTLSSEDYDATNNQCLFIDPSTVLYWTDARIFCEGYQGSNLDTSVKVVLAGIHSLSEWNYLTAKMVIRGVTSLFLGGTYNGSVTQAPPLDEIRWEDGKKDTFRPSTVSTAFTDNPDKYLYVTPALAPVWREHDSFLEEYYVCKYDMPSCYGVAASAVASVCNAHGYCVGRDHCECFSGGLYGASRCTKCCGNDCNPSTQCSQRGTCPSAGSPCDCTTPGSFGGDSCEVLKCGGVLSTDARVCSSHGSCVLNAQLDDTACICTPDHSGPNCASTGAGRPDSKKSSSAAGAVVGTLLSLFGICCVVCIIGILSVVGIVMYIYRTPLKQRLGLIEKDGLKFPNDGDIDANALASFKINREMFVIDFEKVQLISQIGSGGSDSVIYKAKWESLEVACKGLFVSLGVFYSHFLLVYRTLTTGQTDFQDFEREVALMSSLSHPNVIHFYGRR